MKSLWTLFYKKIFRKGFFALIYRGGDLVPGFIDLQLYGGKNGFFVRDLSEESLADMVQTHRQDGIVGLVPTLYSTSHERILKAIEVTKLYIEAGKTGVLGLHIEGPFINFTKRGAHSAHAVRVPTKAEIAEIIAASYDDCPRNMARRIIASFAGKRNYIVIGAHQRHVRTSQRVF